LSHGTAIGDEDEHHAGIRGAATDTNRQTP
jgi:hypothetical protein